MGIDRRAVANPTLRGAFACLATAFVLASPSAARARDWNLGGTWQFYQNNGITVTFDIQQNAVGGALTGAGHYGGAHGVIHGGAVEGNGFKFTVAWLGTPGDASGAYLGIIGADGSIRGSTYGGGSGAVPFHEYSGKKAGCAPTAQTPLLPPAFLVKTRFCEAYAGTAATVIRQAQQLACGFDGPRWSLQEDHRKWCVGLGDNYSTLAGVETDARATGLINCRKKIAAAEAAGLSDRPPLESKPILHGSLSTLAPAHAWDPHLHRFVTSPPK